MDVSVAVPLKLDPITGAPAFIDYAHHEIHDGYFFSCSYYLEGMGAGDKISVSFLTGAKKIHIFWEAVASALAVWRVFENPTITTNTGSTLPVYNHERSSARQTTVIDRSPVTPAAGAATLGATITADGTPIRQIPLGGSNRSGGEARNEGEFLLKLNEEYLFQIEARVASVTAGMILKWYENG